MSQQAGNKVTRGERILERIVADGLISEQGKSWMIAAIDPFHDHQLKQLDGWPDVQTGASVVRIIKQSVTIAKPAGLLAGNWDCHIVQWPWLTSNQSGSNVGNVAQVVSRQGQILGPINVAAVNHSLCGGLQAYAMNPGTPLFIVTNAACILAASMNVPQVYTKGTTRLIGMGFEVHNTTSQLNLQGAVIGYRQMANDNRLSTFVLTDTSTAPISSCTFDGYTVRYPPINAQEAMLLSGSRQWEAKEGIYSVSAFHTTENPATVVSPVSPVILGDQINDLEGVISTGGLNCMLPGPPLATSGLRAMPGFRVFNVHQSGAIFTGLSETTTLTINWNVFLETFPSTEDGEILPLATPSAEFDPDALDLYSRVIVDLPVAVPVKENGLGDWFYDAASTAIKYLAPAISAIPHPLAQAVGGVLNGAVKAINEDKPKKKKKQAFIGPQRMIGPQQQPPPNSWGPAPVRGRTQKRGKPKNKNKNRSQTQPPPRRRA